jgi:hypothetical protein
MDIVERLRNLEWMIDQKELNEAADEIERLREALEEVGSYVAGGDWHYMSDKTLAVVDRTLGEKE